MNHHDESFCSKDSTKSKIYADHQGSKPLFQYQRKKAQRACCRTTRGRIFCFQREKVPYHSWGIWEVSPSDFVHLNKLTYSAFRVMYMMPKQVERRKSMKKRMKACIRRDKKRRILRAEVLWGGFHSFSYGTAYFRVLWSDSQRHRFWEQDNQRR